MKTNLFRILSVCFMISLVFNLPANHPVPAQADGQLDQLRWDEPLIRDIVNSLATLTEEGRICIEDHKGE